MLAGHFVLLRVVEYYTHYTSCLFDIYIGILLFSSVCQHIIHSNGLFLLKHPTNTYGSIYTRDGNSPSPSNSIDHVYLCSDSNS